MSKSFKRASQVLFGGGSQQSSQGPSFNVTNTGYSSFDPVTGKLTLDPSIRNLQEGFLGDVGKIRGDLGNFYNTYQANMQDTRNRLLGDAGAFREARLNPIREQFARLQGETQRGLGLRGLGGSSFGAQTMSALARDRSRAEGDAGALADRETLSAITGIDQSVIDSMAKRIQQETMLAGLPAEIANQRLIQELQALNFGKAQTGQSGGENYSGMFGKIGFTPAGGGWGMG
jgi:hypothetical protein